LLAGRFRLKVHREQKELAVYELTVAEGGPKLTEVPAGAQPIDRGAARSSMELLIAVLTPPVDRPGAAWPNSLWQESGRLNACPTLQRKL
jgi:uncharacterized protein (TIGR03435 family)